jgi:hypothetical protein
MGKMLGVVVMAGIMGLTSWVVASVSTWLVPVYVTVMVLIFATPRTTRPEGTAEEGDGGTPAAPEGDARGANSSSGSSRDPGAPGPTAENGSDQAATAAPGPSASRTAKPRRSRGRGRKASRPAGEPSAPPAAATWIRIGPGKFVRADSQEQGLATSTEPEPQPEAPTGVHETFRDAEGPSPVPDEGPAATVEPEPADVPVPDEPTATQDVSRPQPASFETLAAGVDPQPDSPVDEPEPNVEVVELDPARGEPGSPSPDGTDANDGPVPDDATAPAAVAEEYGIAPSAFGDARPGPETKDAIQDEEDHPIVPAEPDGAGAEAANAATTASEPELAGAEAETATDVAADGHNPSADDVPDDPPRPPYPSGEVATRGDVAGVRPGGIRLQPRFLPTRTLVRSRSAGAHVSRPRNVRSGRGAARSTLLALAVNPHARCHVRRNGGRPRQIHRGFLPRSPPARP